MTGNSSLKIPFKKIYRYGKSPRRRREKWVRTPQNQILYFIPLLEFFVIRSKTLLEFSLLFSFSRSEEYFSAWTVQIDMIIGLICLTQLLLRLWRVRTVLNSLCSLRIRWNIVLPAVFAGRTLCRLLQLKFSLWGGGRKF